MERTNSLLRERALALLRARPDLAYGDLAAHTALAPSTVKNFFGGSQPETERIRAEIQRVVELAERGEILQPGSGRALTVVEERRERVRRVATRHGFYATEMVQRIAQVLDYCAEQATLGLITANYGTGKTEGVAAWRRASGRSVDSVVIEMDEFVAHNKVACVQAIAEALGLPSACGAQNGARMFRDVTTYLREHPTLLIFDQCELCRPRVLQVIRQVWDRTRDAGVGVVLLAAPVLLVRLKASRMQDLGALESRIGIVAPLSGVTKAEMAAIVKQEGLRDISEEGFAMWWRATGGSMRRLMTSLDLLKAKHADKPITEKTIAGVAGSLWGMQVAA